MTPPAKGHKILVLGDTGFVGQEIVRQLETCNIPYVGASRSTGLDLTAADAAAKVEELAQGCDAVISTVGSLLGTPEDETINAANGVAAQGAAQAGVRRFVAIGNDPRVRSFSKTLPMLQNYAKGKETSESLIETYFPDGFTFVQPSLIHGGEEFSATPPRIPTNVGQLAEDILGLYPLQAASEALPGVLGIALQAPLSRERVAKAAINAALGLAKGRLDSRDAIILAASKRPTQEVGECLVEIPVHQSKQDLYDLGDCGGDEEALKKAFGILETIEQCNGSNPATDPVLNGRWEFVFDVEADVGTGVVKDILNGNSPIPMVFDLASLYMVIEDNSRVNIHVHTKVLTRPIELRLSTLIKPDETDPTGTTFLEQFEGIELAGVEFPVPEDWQRSRPLEFSYLDEDMLIARGNGGEPHYLRRE